MNRFDMAYKSIFTIFLDLKAFFCTVLISESASIGVSAKCLCFSSSSAKSQK